MKSLNYHKGFEHLFFSKQISVIYICIRQVATLSKDDTGFINRQMAIASIGDTGSFIYLFILI